MPVKLLAASIFSTFQMTAIHDSKKVYTGNSKCKHTCMCATVLCQLSFHSNKTDRIMENIQIDGLSIKKALRYVLQSKRKNSVERAFNFLQTAYL